MAISDPDWINGPVSALRAWRDMRPEVVNPVMPEGVAVRPLSAEGGCPGGLEFVPLAAGEASGGDIYRQIESAMPVVYFHGGGFIVGSPETHRVVCAWIAAETGARVVSIRYRLAPEHGFPAQAEDAAAAVRRQLVKARRIRIMGDSAGGLVALWAFAGLSVEERARIEDLVLFYPGAGPGMLPAPENTRHDAAGLGPKSLASYHRHLDPARIIAGDPRFDPLTPGFAVPPQLTILAAGIDPILRDSEALAAQFEGRLLVAEGLDHSFLGELPAEHVRCWLRAALDLS